VVSVLVFVHKYIFELVPELFAYFLVVSDKFRRAHYQVSEVERAGFPEFFLIAGVYLGGFYSGRVVDCVGVDCIAFCVQQIVLCSGNYAQIHRCLAFIAFEPQFLHC